MGLTQEVSNIEAQGARMANFGEVVRDLISFSRVDKLSLRQHDELVEERHDVVARLMDSEDDCPAVIMSDRNKNVDDMTESVVSQ